eukprot:scaffold9228_cov118-Skeletonema_dohrnii-CCMP3373.AAC.1
MMIRLTTVALAALFSTTTTVTATISYDAPSSASIDSDAASSSSNLRGIRSSAPQQQEQQATAVTQQTLPQHLSIEQEADDGQHDANYYLRGIRSEDSSSQQQQQQEEPPAPQASSIATSSPQPQQVPLGADKPKLRKKKHNRQASSTTTSTNNPLQKFAQNMLTNQGCPPTPTTSCGDICYVLTPSAATDLHSVAIGTTLTPTHHWHDPTTFWSTGSTLVEVERECGRSLGMATMFVLAKAMEPPSWVKSRKEAGIHVDIERCLEIEEDIMIGIKSPSPMNNKEGRQEHQELDRCKQS